MGIGNSLDDETYYRALWDEQSHCGNFSLGRRSWWHRWFLDRVLPPDANPRWQIASDLLEAGERVLDIGCWGGDGAERMRLLQRFRSVHGVDILEASVAKAKERGIDARVVNLNRHPLPYPDDHFDAVLALAVLPQVFDPLAVTRECARVVRTGGILLVSAANVASFSNRIRIVFGRLPVTSRAPGWDGGQLHYFTLKALRGLLEQMGLTVERTRSCGAAAWLRNRWPSLLGGHWVVRARKRQAAAPSLPGNLNRE
jgi:methionine biosynthesis protein MetW